MPKLKTKRSAAKRFKVTGKGKFRRNKAFGSHILTKKSRQRKRDYRRSGIIEKCDTNHLKEMLPYR